MSETVTQQGLMRGSLAFLLDRAVAFFFGSANWEFLLFDTIHGLLQCSRSVVQYFLCG